MERACTSAGARFHVSLVCHLVPWEADAEVELEGQVVY
jgi:hypothetical protein